jgi:DNA/RNA-binding domain of Phe-tRNA-synthetase-like protein
MGDIDAMAIKTLELVKDIEFRQLCRIQAREGAKRFDAERVIPMYEELYWRTLA